MRTKRFLRTFMVLVALTAAILFRPAIARAAGGAVFTFSDTEITAVAPTDAYTVKNNTNLTISAPGTYTITGSCAEGSVAVAKGVEATLVLDNLTLTSTTTAPIQVKGGAKVTIHLSGDTVITDSEPEDGEGACIKASKADKTLGGASITFCGDGSLTCFGNTKNGIKGGAESTLIFNQTGTITVTGNVSGFAFEAGCVKNAIAADGSVIINSGIFNIYAAGDGIKSDPDVADPADPESTTDLASLGEVTINGGTFNINVDSDAIQADAALTITGGTFNIKTMNGYMTSGSKYTSKTDGFGPSQGTTTSGDFVDDEMSGKGLKASGDRSEDQGTEPTLTVTGGVFNMNTVDDAIHSDGSATITGGTFTIYSGDDGMHGETDLILGTYGSKLDRDPDVSILACYEGLEGSNVYISSGRYWITAKDDGINAAGGSNNGSDPFGPGGGWTPWGGGPGGGGSSTQNYSINVYGGTVYINCDGDGLDSNGTLKLYGGALGVFSMSSGDNSALDADRGITIQGAAVFTAGAKGVDGTVKSSWFPTGQKYQTLSTSFNKGTVLNAKLGNTVVCSVQLPKRATYIMFTAPGMSSAPTIAQGSFVWCKGGSFTHTWDEGVVTVEPTETTTGVMTYTCTKCGATETQTIDKLTHVDECDHGLAQAGYVATFSIVGGSIDVYYTQDYTAPSETDVFTAFARNSETGEIDDSGDGQINFTVNLDDGYSIADITIDGDYNKIKEITSDAPANTYRITKVASDLSITVETLFCSHESVTAEDITWAWDNKGGATASFHCDDCEADYTLTAAVTGELNDDWSLINLTGSVVLGDRTYTDSTTAAPFTATFAGDEGVDSIDVFYIQKNTTPDEFGATKAVARDSKSGMPVITGDGQLNFLINLKEGYVITSVTATEGSYKNIKGPDETGIDNVYRITKVVADMTITVTTAYVTDLSGATVTAEPQIFTGEAIEPEVTVTLDGTTLVKDTDYTVAFENNTNVGTATITVTGIGAYEGTANGTFQIVRAGWGTDADGDYCYYETDGSKRTNNWAQFRNVWYYLGEDGKLVVNGFAEYNGKLYYMGANGRAVTDSWVNEDDVWYYFGSNGAAYTSQWLSYNGAYYYFGADSKLVINGWAAYQGKYYYMGENGQVVVNGWAEYEGLRYYMGANGQAVVSNWVNDGGTYYYMDSNGNPITNGTIIIGDTRYIFDETGACIGSEPAN